MRIFAWTAVGVVGVSLIGCTEYGDNPYAYQSAYPPSGYYAAPPPVYYNAAPYPGYVAPYSAWGYRGERDGWRDRDWHDRDANRFHNDRSRSFRNDQQGPRAQPPGFAGGGRARPTPPPSASQNQRAIDQLGFRRSQ